MSKTKILNKFSESCPYATSGLMWRGKPSKKSRGLTLVKDDENQPSDLVSNLRGEEKTKAIDKCKNYVKAVLNKHFNVPLDNTDLETILSGEGCEWRKMRSVKSSSLCGFLHFYRVNTNHTFHLNGEEYTKVYFEFENDCVDPGRPSSVDVVLTNEDTKSILFLELKFSEYLSNSDAQISTSYKDEYENIFGKKLPSNKGESIELCKNLFLKPDTRTIKTKYGKKIEDCYTLYFPESSDKYYVGGIKQAISHAIGINNFLKNRKGDFDKIGFTPKEVKYAELAFLLDGASTYLKSFGDEFFNLVPYLTNYLVNNNKDYRIEFVSNKPLIYKDLFIGNNNEDLLTKEVKKFYYANLKASK